MACLMFSWFRFTRLSHPPNTDLIKHRSLSPAPMPTHRTAAAAALGLREKVVSVAACERRSFDISIFKDSISC